MLLNQFPIHAVGHKKIWFKDIIGDVILHSRDFADEAITAFGPNFMPVTGCYVTLSSAI